MAWDEYQTIVTGDGFQRPDNRFIVGQGVRENIPEWLTEWSDNDLVKENAEYIFPIARKDLEAAIERCLYQTSGMARTFSERSPDSYTYFRIRKSRMSGKDPGEDSGIVEVHHLTSERSSLIIRRFLFHADDDLVFWERVMQNLFYHLGEDSIWLSAESPNDRSVLNQPTTKHEKRGRSRLSRAEKLDALREWDKINAKESSILLDEFLENLAIRVGVPVAKSTFHSWRKLRD